MNIVYFPFTSIPETIAMAASRRFGHFAVYTPVKGQEPQALVDDNRIEARSPIVGEEDLVMNICRSFRKWGAMHQGRAAGLKHFAESGFYNEQFAAEIRSEILKFGGDPSRQQTDPILNARAFLQLAQEFDLEEAEIARQLAAADTATKQLFDELKGEGYNTDENVESSADIPEDAGAFMTEARLAAWCLLAGTDEMPPDAFLTHSRSVLEKISDRFSSLVHLAEFFAVPDSQANGNGIVERIDRLAKAAWDGPETTREEFDFPVQSPADAFRTDIFVIPDLSPDSLIRSFIDSPSGSALPASDARHSFICLMSPRK